MSKVVVVGGGAAGMMAAVAAGRNGNEVLLIEKNEKLGKKLFITGKGRCNLTNDSDEQGLLANVVRNPKFLYSAFYGFNSAEVMDMVENAGCPLKTERGARVFPVSDRSSDVIKAFERLLDEAHVEVCLNTSVREIIVREGKAVGVRVLKKNANHTASKTMPIGGDFVIVCTGGFTYPLTGSTGDGYRFAQMTGHTVVKPRPSLVPFITKEKWPGNLAGLSLKNVSLIVKNGNKEISNGFGEMLFTHHGISGPLVLTASCYTDFEKMKDVHAFIDLKPALSEEQLDKRVLRDFSENENKSIINALSALLPQSLIPVVVSESGIDKDKKVHDITKAERAELIRNLKGLHLTVTGSAGPEEAIITSGGVSVKEIDPATMESKIVKGLFFAGEVLDVDALTGGFNLQIAWSTGYAAGSSTGE